MITWSDLRTWVRRWLPVAAIVLLAVVGRLMYLSQSHLSQAKAHHEGGEYEDALWDYQWALRHYVPGWPANVRAVEGLKAIAEHWRELGDTENERRALRRLRSSLYAVRSVYQPFAETLASVESDLRALGEPIEED